MNQKITILVADDDPDVRYGAIRPDLPIIVCTGFREKINEQIARDMGIKGYLMKPIVISQLACMVRNAIDGPPY
jgi:CheY-like chemotaxis protein